MIAPGISELPRRTFGRATLLIETPGAGVVVSGAVIAFWLAIVVAALPQELVQDGWLALASGREIVQHGLPHTDVLTAWTAGRQWIDQQWLGQLFLYGLWTAGGIRLVMLTHALILVLTVALGIRAARSLGAGSSSIVLSSLAVLVIAPWGMQMRTQDLGELFFVALIALLATDSRTPSKRVYLALPLLVLWANIHGSVALGAGLVATRALTLGFGAQRKPSRSLVLLAGAALSPVASPYGFALVGYYRHLLFNPLLHWFINEWGASTPSLKTAAFYGLAFATVWLLARHGKRLPLFGRIALLLTLVAGITSIRNIVWFGLAALVLLPPLFDPVVNGLRFNGLRRLQRPAAIAVAATVIGIAAFAVVRPIAWFTSEWPTAAATRIAALADRTDARVMADDRYADWLLWTEPQLRGRIAYDVRFELFNRSQIYKLAYYRNRIGDDWRAATTGYPIIVFDPAEQKEVEDGLLATGRFRIIERSPEIVVLQRTQLGPRSR
jgi:hypothetical protein